MALAILVSELRRQRFALGCIKVGLLVFEHYSLLVRETGGFRIWSWRERFSESGNGESVSLNLVMARAFPWCFVNHSDHLTVAFFGRLTVAQTRLQAWPVNSRD